MFIGGRERTAHNTQHTVNSVKMCKKPGPGPRPVPTPYQVGIGIYHRCADDASPPHSPHQPPRQ